MNIVMNVVRVALLLLAGLVLVLALQATLGPVERVTLVATSGGLLWATTLLRRRTLHA